MKKVRAFTLIELIVVIAIVAILTAILVPTIMGYLNESKLSSANANAKLVYDQTAIYCTECENAGTPMSSGSFYVDLRVISDDAEYSKDGKHIKEALQFMLGQYSDSAGIAVTSVDAGIVLDSVWAKTESDRFVGHYPGEYTKKSDQPIQIPSGN